MADTLTVTKARPEDRDAWLRLWGEWQTHMKGRVPVSVSETAWTMIMDPDSGLNTLLARQDEVVLGFANVSRMPFAWTAGEVLFLQDLFVSESARGAGVGAALLEGVYAFADELDAHQVFWMVDENDPELQRFYERHAIRTPYLRYMRKAWPW